MEPQVDLGRFPIKRVIGEAVTVEADVFADGHDQVACALLYRREYDQDWSRIAMKPIGNDRFRAEFQVAEPGATRWKAGWITWRPGAPI